MHARGLKELLILVSLLVILLVIVSPIQSSSALNITVQTNKPSYQIEENIEIYGNLTYDGLPVQNKLVGLEVDNPLENPILVRTLQTDSLGTYNTTFRLGSGADMGTYTVTVTASLETETATGNTTFNLLQIMNTTVLAGSQSYTITTESNATIADVTADQNMLNFSSSGPSGQRAYINITLPVGLNQTTIRVWVDNAEVVPPPFPIITTNGTHYFLYFEFHLSTPDIAIQYAVLSVQGGGGGRMPYMS